MQKSKKTAVFPILVFAFNDLFSKERLDKNENIKRISKLESKMLIRSIFVIHKTHHFRLKNSKWERQFSHTKRKHALTYSPYDWAVNLLFSFWQIFLFFLIERKKTSGDFFLRSPQVHLHISEHTATGEKYGSSDSRNTDHPISKRSLINAEKGQV